MQKNIAMLKLINLHPNPNLSPCCGSVVSITNTQCPEGEGARVRALGFVQKCFVEDYAAPYNAAFWGSNTNWDNLLNGVVGPPAIPAYAAIAEYFRGEFSAEAVTGDGFGSQQSISTGMNCTITGQFRWSSDNQIAFNDLNKSGEYWVVFATETQIFVSAVPVSIFIAPSISNNTGEEVLWEVTITWTSKDIPFGYNKPTDYFN